MINLKKLRTEHGYSQLKLAGMIGVSRSTVAMWENGSSQPDHEMILRLSALFEVTTDEFLGRAPISAKSSGAVRIKVYGDVAAGIPIDAIEDFDPDNPDDWEEISAQTAKNGEFFALRLKGDSMEPKMSNGDIVIVRRQPDAESGEIAIVCVNGDNATCKKIKKTPEGIILISMNSDYEPMFFTNEQIEKLPVTILGKVVELRAKF